MKAGTLTLLVIAFLAGSASAGLAYRHFYPEERPYLAQPVERLDIEATVDTLGHISDNMAIVEALVPEADVFKLHPGQQVFFDMVAVPDSRFEGTVEEIKAMPIAAERRQAQKEREAKSQADAQAVDAAPPPADRARAMGQPTEGSDLFSSDGEGVYYRVLFNMGDTSGRYPAGMSVMTHVVLGVAKQTPAVSIASLGKSLGADRYEIEVLDAKGRIVTREISTGLSNSLSIQVKSGLEVGDQVVIRDDGDLFKPGYRG